MTISAEALAGQVRALAGSLADALELALYYHDLFYDAGARQSALRYRKVLWCLASKAERFQ